MDLSAILSLVALIVVVGGVLAIGDWVRRVAHSRHEHANFHEAAERLEEALKDGSTGAIEYRLDQIQQYTAHAYNCRYTPWTAEQRVADHITHGSLVTQAQDRLRDYATKELWTKVMAAQSDTDRRFALLAFIKDQNAELWMSQNDSTSTIDALREHLQSLVLSWLANDVKVSESTVKDLHNEYLGYRHALSMQQNRDTDRLWNYYLAHGLAMPDSKYFAGMPRPSSRAGLLHAADVLLDNEGEGDFVSAKFILAHCEVSSDLRESLAPLLGELALFVSYENRKLCL
ncbi:MAG: hypothetical protein WBP12_03345 [Candidatus Saccharimonas sp.]